MEQPRKRIYFCTTAQRDLLKRKAYWDGVRVSDAPAVWLCIVHRWRSDDLRDDFEENSGAFVAPNIFSAKAIPQALADKLAAHGITNADLMEDVLKKIANKFGRKSVGRFLDV